MATKSSDSEARQIQIPKVPLAEQLHSKDVSSFQRYRLKALGETSLLKMVQFELTTVLLSDLPGALGYLFRRLFYPLLFKQVGQGAILGKGIILRHPKRIILGHHVAIDDYVMLDAGESGEDGIYLGDRVILSRGCLLHCKGGSIIINTGADLGVNAVLSSIGGITIGNSVLVAGNCYIGGGRYFTDRLEIPIIEQGLFSRGPVIIGDGSWLGAGVVVLDGVSIGKGCVVGAGAVVTNDLPDYAIAVGVPARIVQMRDEEIDSKVSSVKKRGV